jgi:hypothetical protein
MFSPDEALVQATTNETAISETDAAIDYDALMQANLTRVFGERNAERRLKAIGELYAKDAVLNEPHTSAKGHAAINQAVTELLSSLPPEFSFAPLGSAIGHHGIGRLRWSAGPPRQPPAVTGMDVVHFRQGRIHSLFVFLDPPSP